jgi:DNA-binding Lrp family transcriptional regulator
MSHRRFRPVSVSLVEDLDRRILTLLATDGRMSFTDLGKATGLSTSAVHQRVKRLEQRGLIKGYGATIDYDQVGMPLTAFISIRPIDPSQPDDSPDRLSGISEIESCWSVAGDESYILKVRVGAPIDLEELLARVRAALRRGGPQGQHLEPMTTDHFRLDFAERRATVAGADVRLTPTEWRLLEALCREPGHLVSQQDLLRAVWGPSYGRESNYLRVYANQLRRKLEPDPANPRHLVTEPGLGYRFTP